MFSSLFLCRISLNYTSKVFGKTKRCFSSSIVCSSANIGLQSFILNEEKTINQIASNLAEPYVDIRQVLKEYTDSKPLSPTRSSLINFHVDGSIRKPAINVQYIINNTEEIKRNLALRGITNCNLEELIGAYNQFQKVEYEVEKFQEARREAAAQKQIDKIRYAENMLQILGYLSKQLEKIYLVNALAIPNKTSPLSLAENGSKRLVMETVGKKPTFEHTVYDHIYIGKRFKSLRQKNMSRMAGQRNSFFFGGLAELEHALVCYTIDKLKSHGFFMVSVPNMLKDAVFEGAGVVNDKLNSMVYKIENAAEPNFYLSGTSEVGLCAYFSGHSVSIADLPLKVCCISTCHRRETANRFDRYGIFRIHQFLKVEMFGVTANETGSESENLFQNFVEIQKELFSELGLHFNVVNMPANDLGLPAYKKFDVEAWFPGRDKYEEISSASNCTDYQSRRLNILYKNNDFYKHAHTVNATACAVPRMIIALLENGQQANIEIALPSCLWPYMNGKKTIRKEFVRALEYVGIDQSKHKQEKIYKNLLD